jgi:hypothetical protein
VWLEGCGQRERKEWQRVEHELQARRPFSSSALLLLSLRRSTNARPNEEKDDCNDQKKQKNWKQELWSEAAQQPDTTRPYKQLQSIKHIHTKRLAAI